VIFENEEESCINIIKSIQNEKILLVTSGSEADRILSFDIDDGQSIHKRVHSVFIFCYEKDKYLKICYQNIRKSMDYTPISKN
jgi:hypothetical protein